MVLVVGSVLALGSAQAWRLAATADRDQRFVDVGRDTTAVLTEGMRRHEDLARAAGALFTGTADVDDAGFGRFATSVELERRFPAVRALTWIEVVPDGASTGERYVVRFAEPVEAAEAFVGRDLAASPATRPVLEQARDGGTPVLTGVRRLPGDDGAGLSLYVPAFGLPAGSPSERRAALRGWVGVTLEPQTLLDDATAPQLPEGVAVAWYAGPVADEADLLATDGDVEGIPLTVDTRVYGRDWTLEYRAGPAFATARESRGPAIVAVGGLLLTGLVAGLVWHLGRGRRRARRAAARAQHRVRTLEREHRMLFAGTPGPLAVIDRSGRITRVNAALARMIGHPASRLRGAPLEALVEVDDAGAALSALRRVLDGEAERDELALLVRTESGPVGAHLVLGAVPGGRGTPDHVLGSFLPVPQPRSGGVEGRLEALAQAVQALQRLHADAGAALDRACALGMALTRADGAAVVLDTRGALRTDVGGCGLLSEGSRRDDEDPADLAAQAVATGRPHRSDDVQADGHINQPGVGAAVRSLVAVPLHAGDAVTGAVVVVAAQRARFGEADVRTLELVAGVLGAVLALREATAGRRRLVTDAARANAEAERLAYVVSHDIDAALKAVVDATEALPRASRGRREDEALARLRARAVDLQRLMQGVAEYARIGAGPRIARPTDCQEVLARLLVRLGDDIERAGATITHDPLPVVEVDPDHLEELFAHLIVNALRFRSDESPAIHVGAHSHNGRWTLSVRDNGVGLDPAHFDRIFALFERLSVNAADAGEGIGLAVCKKIVERHGGTIWVDSEPGRGATFSFTLPTASTIELAAEPELGSAPRS